jgi:hypothetical protein
VPDRSVAPEVHVLVVPLQGQASVEYPTQQTCSRVN